MSRVATHLSGVLLVILLPCLAGAQPAAAPPEAPAPVRELLRLLDEPSVRTWLNSELNSPGAPSPAAASGPTEPPREPTVSDLVAKRVETAGEHFRTVLSALPALPDEVAQAAGRMTADLQERGILEIVVLLAAFILLGLGVEQLFWWATAHFRIWVREQPTTTLQHRLRSIGLRMTIGLISVAVFAVGSVGTFLIFSWPPLLKQIVLTYLLAAVAVRLVLVILQVLLLPNPRQFKEPERHRVIPASTPLARFWHRRLVLATTYLAACWASLEVLASLGFSSLALSGIAQLLGLGLFLLTLGMIWRRPSSDVAPNSTRRRIAGNTALTIYVLFLALLWIAGFPGFFWLGVMALLLPKALSITAAAVAHLLRPAEVSVDPEEPVAQIEPSAASSIAGVFLERGLRAALIVAAALFLAHAWDIDLVAMTTNHETLGERIVRSTLSIVVILLLADLLWQVLKAIIDHNMTVKIEAEPGTELAVRQARLRTLLPIFRNILVVVIAGCAILMTLSELGVEIGPLIAGAGVVGVAVGFGAQTVVKDIISGIFYLLDDAFRVGEYIQSGSYTGTVESFSLRSVKLRAPRGPIFTVPFGQLGAVENLSRDWAIDKFQIGVTYDTDLDLARRLIKKVGEELKANPEFGPSIIEPLKMQGVQEFGAYAIEIRFKMTTRPGEQTTIRRKAYAMIKKTFDENGIKFAFPTVQIAGGEDTAVNSAVANQALELLHPAKAAGG